jgi:hypothetical protein
MYDFRLSASMEVISSQYILWSSIPEASIQVRTIPSKKISHDKTRTIQAIPVRVKDFLTVNLF